MILDLYGNPIKPQDLKTEVAAPQPSGVRSVASRHSMTGIDPARLARMLKDAEQDDASAYLELAEEMEEKYLHYSAQLATRKRAVSGIPGEIVPASDDARDRKVAEFVEESLPMIQAASFDMLDALGKGYSATEIIWDLSGKAWRPERLEFRDPRWFCFDKVDGRTLLLKSEQNPKGEPLKPGKFIIHRSAAKTGLPIRGGLARAACWAYLFQNFGLKEWVTFIEMFGKPLRLGRYEAGSASPADLSVLFAALQGLGTDASAMLPKSMEIEFPEVAQARGENGLWLALLEYLDRQVSKLVLGQTLTADTGKGGGGSYALGNVHNEVRMDILWDDAQSLAATINRDLIPLLVNLNFAGVTEYPEYKLRVEEPEDLQALAGIVEKAVAMGQPVSTRWFSERFGIPLPEEEDDVLGQRAALPDGSNGSEGESKTAAHIETKFDASLINAYSMGIDRFVRLGLAVPEQFVRDVFSIPVPEQGEKLLEATAEIGGQTTEDGGQSVTGGKAAANGSVKTPSPPVGEGWGEGFHRTAQSAAKQPSSDPDAVEIATSRLTREAAPHIEKWLNQIEAMLEAAGSLEEFQTMLLAAYPTLDSQALTNTLAAATTALDLRGRAEAQGGE